MGLHSLVTEEAADGSSMEEIMKEIIQLVDISVKSLHVVIRFVFVDIHIVQTYWTGMVMEVA